MDDNAPLTGIRVLDLSQYIPGPFATRQLAALGADVIKIEPPAGDPMRRFMHCGDGDSPLYRHLNRGKRITRIDLKQADGRARLDALLVDADVLLDSFRPGVLARLGLPGERLRKLNPRLIHCALSGFGQAGPYRDRAGHDLTYCAAAGLLGDRRDGRPPAIVEPPLADHAGALQAVNAILAALFARQRTGRGASLDISLYSAAREWNYLGRLTPTDAPDAGLLRGDSACYNLYRTADRRWVALAALEEKFWRRFCERVGRPDWIERRAEAPPQQRLIDELRALFAERPLAHWRALLEPADCCFEAVWLPEEAADHPQAGAGETATLPDSAIIDAGQPLAWRDRQTG